ncbi:hypothetical protein KAU33_11270 [Candidatus Dependentiae bacterium]|nr:hypothetical protein [Candidatus Dependentiae bacterium]
MDNICDGLRFIDSFNTQVRSLPVCIQFLHTIDNSIIPNEIVKNKLLHWSVLNEESNNFYKYSNGKLTNNSKPTTAYNHYIQLLVDLGLIDKQNTLLKTTKIAKVLLALTSEIHNYSFPFSNIQKAFIFYILLIKDADGLILILDFLKKNPNSSQQIIINNFKDILLQRLQIKKENSFGIVRSKISEKYLKIDINWTKSEKYAEHLIPPRLEWLEQLEIISIDKSSNSQRCRLTSQGNSIINNLIEYENIHDVNNFWLENNFSKSIIPFLKISKKLRSWNNQIQVLEQSLLKLFNTFGLDEAYRIPLNFAKLYLLLDIFIINGISIEMSQIIELFDKNLVFGKISYYIKTSPRETESYITMRINND